MLDNNTPSACRTGHVMRLELFSDAIFAIAITIIAVEIKPERHTSFEEAGGLRAIWPAVFAYLLTFAIVGLQWIDHHTIFQHLYRCTGTLPWVNFVFLMCIAFIPLPTALITFYPSEAAPVVLYSGSVGATILAKLCLWKYVTSWAHLVSPDLPAQFIRSKTRLWTKGLLVALLLMTVAISLPRMSLVGWLLFGAASFANRVSSYRKEHESPVALSDAQPRLAGPPPTASQ